MYVEKELLKLISMALACETYSDFLEHCSFKTRKELKSFLKTSVIMLITIADTEEIGLVENGFYRKIGDLKSFYEEIHKKIA